MASNGKTLFVKTHAFGDAMLCTPAVREWISQAGPGTGNMVLTGPSAAAVWARLSGVKEVVEAPFPPRGPARALGLIGWSLSNRRLFRDVSLAIVFQGDPRVRRWVRFLTGAPVRSSGAEPLGSWETVFPMMPSEFAGEAYARVAGVSPESWRPSFQTTDAEKRWAEERLGDQRCFAVAPGGGDNPRDSVPEKRWPSGRFAAIAGMLLDSGIRPVLIGGPADRSLALEVMSGASGGIIDLTGRTDWGRTAAVLQRSTGFIGADSGPAHLAMATGTPAVVIFGPTDPAALYPEDGVTALKSDTGCSPCYSNSLFPGCVNPDRVCTESVSVEDAWKGVSRIIHEDNGS